MAHCHDSDNIIALGPATSSAYSASTSRTTTSAARTSAWIETRRSEECGCRGLPPGSMHDPCSGACTIATSPRHDGRMSIGAPQACTIATSLRHDCRMSFGAPPEPVLGGIRHRYCAAGK